MLRRLGRRVLPKSRARTLLNSVLRWFERRRGIRYSLAGMTLVFEPGSLPFDAASQDSDPLDAQQLELFARLIGPGQWVADVGAYRGEYAVVAALRAGSTGRVFAFEPAPANADFIARNGARNGVADRIVIEARAVSNTAAPLTFYHTDTFSSSSSLFQSALRDVEIAHTTVQATSLDAYFAPYERLPDVVKIDVEGAEWQVLLGAERIVASDALIFCELHPFAWAEAGCSWQELRAWLRARGRIITAIDSSTELSQAAYGPTLLRRISKP